MRKNLTIVARIEAREDKIELVKSELIKLIEPIRAENGCIQYDLHQDTDNPAVFIFYENWENRELWQDHMRSNHIAAYGYAVRGAVMAFDLNEMTIIG